ncbi:MAG TPA: universal stress protein [Acidothermaceae bacterium]|nr:universal stress protein [Acidothermaceae bacterium]
MTACHDTSSWGVIASPNDARIAGAILATRFRRVVVGVDGSPNSIAALRFAVGLAGRDGGVVDAICAYHPYVQAQYPFALAVPPYGLSGEGVHDGNTLVSAVMDAEVDARHSLENAMNAAFGCSQLVGVQLIALEGSAHEILTRSAQNADLLIVGARGHSGPLARVLGSTAQACTRHAHCPVLVVPSPVSVVPGPGHDDAPLD